MEFGWSAEALQLRDDARALFGEMVTDEVRARVRETGTHDDSRVRRALAEKGWLSAHWPPDEGGRGWDGLTVAALFDEAGRSGAPFEGYLNTMLVAELLRRVGSEQQRAEVLPRLVRGEALVALGISEPESGSDAAAAKLRAERDGDGWRLDGQKMFTTFAEVADYVLVLARTNPDVAKHRGLTTFLVPTQSEGFSLAPVATMGGERTNITFYTDLYVPDDARVGAIDDGWTMMGLVLSLERGVFPVVPGRCARLLEQAVEWARSQRDPVGRSRLADPVVREQLAWIAITNEVGRLLALRTVATHAEGRVPVVEGSMTKLFTTEAMQHVAATLLDIVGVDGLIADGSGGAIGGGVFERAYRHAPLETITGGTSEIQRDIIATAGLGLPRSR
ncbi:MAG: acyl-CoA dehydrogenase family protein [Acidimicrobiales bacterium]